MEIFANIASGLMPLTIFTKKLPPRCLIGSNYASGIIIICKFIPRLLNLLKRYQMYLKNSPEPCVPSPDAILKSKPLLLGRFTKKNCKKTNQKEFS